MTLAPSTIFVAVAAALLVAMALVHAYWALGGQVWRDAAIPTKDGRPVLHPSPATTWLVAIALLLAAIVLLGGVSLVTLPMPPAWDTATCWLVAAMFAGRAIGEFRYVGFFKRVRGTRFAQLDNLVYTPLCVFLGFAAAVAAL